MKDITLRELLEAGCHFGHRADRWHPKAYQFIYQKREKIHIIDLAKTKEHLDKAAEFIKTQAQEGKKILFVGTKKQAAQIIKEKAIEAGLPYFTQRWIGGFFTNWEQVYKNIERTRRMMEEKESGAWKKFPKHERTQLSKKLNRLLHHYAGVVKLTAPPDILFVVDVKRERTAVAEAKHRNVPIIAVIDTNADPTGIKYPIPSNDDAQGAVALLVTHLIEAYTEGKVAYDKGEIKRKENEAREVEKKKNEEKTRAEEPPSTMATEDPTSPRLRGTSNNKQTVVKKEENKKVEVKKEGQKVKKSVNGKK